MPIYEYRCEQCRNRMTILARTIGEAAPACSRCGGPRVSRLLSRFAAPRSDEARLDALADPSRLGGLDENDPGSVARWMKRMSRETGEDLGEDLEEGIDQAMDEASAESSGAEHGAPDA
jgi:putative FmdB family regulatory protein